MYSKGIMSSLEAYRGIILNPTSDEQGDFKGFEMITDGVVVVKDGVTQLAQDIQSVMEMKHDRLTSVGLRLERGVLYQGHTEIGPTDHVIAPGMVDTHTHIYQPTGLGGRLMVWLERMFEKGEIPAKQSVDVAREMARERLTELAANGTTRVIAWPTSSAESARIVLEEAEKLALEVRVSFVAMDQNVPDALAEDEAATLGALDELFEEFGEKIVIIDRFPIAVSSSLRKKLATLARERGVLYEVHLDENQEEMAFVRELYDNRSVVKVLTQDGVFAPGMKVGLAHSIHTNHEDMESLRMSIRAGCQVFIRACPSSNETLESHWIVKGEDRSYRPFPLRDWLTAKAHVTTGTDLGAGNNFSIYKELLEERGRHDEGVPSPTELLQFGALNGGLSFGKTVADMKIMEDCPADFAVVKGAEADESIEDRVEQAADRLIRGGANGPESVVATYVEGRRVV
jgi:cytosine/adenosine deaminase-related metal-dependent hydrolase